MSKAMWNDIKDYEGSYQVSNHGRVKSLKRMRADGKQGLPGMIMKALPNGNGYRGVALFSNCKAKPHLIHRLVAQSFIPNPHNKKTVNHKNGRRHDNHIDNLEWMTHSENMKHACLVPWNKGIRTMHSKVCPKCKIKFECHRKRNVFCSAPCAARANLVKASKVRWLNLAD